LTEHLSGKICGGDPTCRLAFGNRYPQPFCCGHHSFTAKDIDIVKFCFKLLSHFSLATLFVMIAGCLTIPGESEIREQRSERADSLIHHLATRSATNTLSCHLSGELHLAAAIDKALILNTSLRQARLEREIAKANITTAYSEVLPMLSLDASYVRYDEELGTLRDGNFATTRYRDRYRAGLRLQQPLLSGSMGPALRSSRIYRLWAEANIRQAEEDIRYAVTAAYYDAVLSEHLLQVNIAATETAERQLADTRVRRQQGMASNYDELRAEVEVANFQAQVLKARNDKDVALTSLFRLLGVSPESNVTLADNLPLVVESLPFDDALRIALELRPDLIQADYAVRLQREALADARASYWPKVSAYLSQTWGRSDPHNSSRNTWGDEWEFGILASLPLFDGLDRTGRTAVERARLSQRELALRDLEEMAASEVRQRLLSLTTAEEFARSQSRSLDTAREALRLVEAGLREGQNTPVEVMDARQALTTASGNYYQSLYNHAMARVALQKAMGLLSSGLLPDGAVLQAM